ncbi:MAG: hypothetical protein A2176_14070 [Spirochaetes bacterium RBG_13_51_14]|nr:MAG: hypothetical protein A2176_14070 [Spirochaetes bacterium RBG_13_51_14]
MIQSDAMKKHLINRLRRRARVYITTSAKQACILVAAMLTGLYSISASAEEIRKTVKTSAAVAEKAEKKVAIKETAPAKKTEKNQPKEKAKEPLQTDDKKAEWIEQTLDYGVQEDRMRAIVKIEQIKDTAIKGKLVKKLIGLMKEEEDPEVLTKAITTLGEIKDSSAIPLMTQNLHHQSEEVRTASVYGLKSLKAVSARDDLIRKLKEQDLGNNANFTNALIQTLGEFKAVELVPFSKEALESNKTHKGIKESLVLFLGTVQSRDAKETLLKIYRDEDEDTMLRAFAVNSLSKLGMKDVAADIKKVVNTIDSYDAKKRKNYYSLHLYSIAALVKLGDREAVPKLINALRSNNPQVRLKAVTLIKEFKDKRTIDILKYKMKNDQNAGVRTAAKKALEEMGVDTKEEIK